MLRRVYTIQRGDTLTEVARALGVSVGTIFQHNRGATYRDDTGQVRIFSDVNKIWPGMPIMLPGSDAPVTPPPVRPSPAPSPVGPNKPDKVEGQSKAPLLIAAAIAAYFLMS